MSTKCSISCEREPEWGTEFTEELTAPVPDLYPELSDSLPNIQEIESEQGEMAKGLVPFIHLSFVVSVLSYFSFILSIICSYLLSCFFVYAQLVDRFVCHWSVLSQSMSDLSFVNTLIIVDLQPIKGKQHCRASLFLPSC